MANLYEKIGEFTPDNLVYDTTDVIVGAGLIKKLGTAGTIKRGTILMKDNDGKLVTAAASAGTAYAILCDDVYVGTTTDVTVPVYLAGSFNKAATIVAANYTLTATDVDNLRNGGIFLKSMQG